MKHIPGRVSRNYERPRKTLAKTAGLQVDILARAYDLRPRSSIHSEASLSYFVKFQVLTVAGMKLTAFWNIMPCVSLSRLSFSGAYCRHHQGDNGGSTHLLNSVYFNDTRGAIFQKVIIFCHCLSLHFHSLSRVAQLV
jgi:hypothetical protein